MPSRPSPISRALSRQRVPTVAETRLTYDYVTRTIARTLGTPSRGYFMLLGAAVALLAIGIITLVLLIRYGLGLAGYSHPVYWAVYITCFVFWVGIAHSGTLISAILFLFRSGWRTAARESREAPAVRDRPQNDGEDAGAALPECGRA